MWGEQGVDVSVGARIFFVCPPPPPPTPPPVRLIARSKKLKDGVNFLFEKLMLAPLQISNKSHQTARNKF